MAKREMLSTLKEMKNQLVELEVAVAFLSTKIDSFQLEVTRL